MHSLLMKGGFTTLDSFQFIWIGILLQHLDFCLLPELSFPYVFISGDRYNPRQDSMRQGSGNESAGFPAARHVALESASLSMDCISRATAALECSPESPAEAITAFKSVAALFLRHCCASLQHIEVRDVERSNSSHTFVGFGALSLN